MLYLQVYQIYVALASLRGAELIMITFFRVGQKTLSTMDDPTFDSGPVLIAGRLRIDI